MKTASEARGAVAPPQALAGKSLGEINVVRFCFRLIMGTHCQLSGKWL